MTFTTDQQPYLQGFIPTLQLYLYQLSGGAVSPANTDTSLAYVTIDNVDIYLARPGSRAARKTRPRSDRVIDRWIGGQPPIHRCARANDEQTWTPAILLASLFIRRRGRHRPIESGQYR